MQYYYEVHDMKDSFLPFIFHKEFYSTSKEQEPNWHENIEFLQCIDGKGVVRSDDNVYPFHTGDVFAVNADTLHSLGTEKQLTYRCLIVDNSFFFSNGIPIDKLQFRELIRSREIYALFEEIVQAYSNLNTQDYQSILAVRICVLQFLQALLPTYTVAKTPSASTAYIKQAITYIRQNFSQPISLESVADYVGVSKFHFSRQFRCFTGSTVVQTINRIRCVEAQRRIEKGMGVSEAALTCGFDNLSYFTITFKKHMGKLPSDCKAKKGQTDS